MRAWGVGSESTTSSVAGAMRERRQRRRATNRRVIASDARAGVGATTTAGHRHCGSDDATAPPPTATSTTTDSRIDERKRGGRGRRRTAIGVPTATAGTSRGPETRDEGRGESGESGAGDLRPRIAVGESFRTEPVRLFRTGPDGGAGAESSRGRQRMVSLGPATAY